MPGLSALVDRFRATAPGSVRHKLHAVRFGRMLESLRLLVELCDDATEKLGGEWILDRSYVIGFIQRTLERAREVVFDAAVLAGDDGGDLHARLDAVRVGLTRLTAAGRPGARGDAGAAPPGLPEDGAVIGGAPIEEPEYRLLREAIRRLTPPRRAPAPPDPRGCPAAPCLAEVLRDAHEGAVRSFARLHLESWGRRAGTSLAGSGFPGSVRVVDAGGGLAGTGAHGSRPGLGWERVRSSPLRTLLDPRGVSPPRPSASVGPRPAALAILSAERALVSIDAVRGALLVDARLGEHAEANLVYCAVRGEPASRVGGLARVLTARGFRLLDLDAGVTGWLAGRGEEETRDALGRLGNSLAGALGGPAGDWSPFEEDRANAAGPPSEGPFGGAGSGGDRA